MNSVALYETKTGSRLLGYFSSVSSGTLRLHNPKTGELVIFMVQRERLQFLRYATVKELKILKNKVLTCL